MSNLSFLVLLLLISSAVAVGVCSGRQYSRNEFPPNFVFGSGTSAYQVEGAANEDGRKPSIWDTFTHAGYTGGATGDIACDQYHKYKEDVKLMANIGLNAYRFSISWSRLIPNGRGPVNPKGLQYYNNLINELLSHGIQPHVGLFHFDLPQTLEDEYGGWISRRIVKDFTAYADVCFREFGDRVQYWSTVNEPNVFTQGGYDTGFVPPVRCSPPFGTYNCTRGNSTTEPYIAAHHILLAHASTVRLYRKKYQEKQQGFIGLSIYTLWYTPFTDSKEDIIATQRANDFLIGWFLDPLVFGDYPEIMKKNVGSRLPSFTDDESKLVKGSLDFIGIIYYVDATVKDNPDSLKKQLRDFSADIAATILSLPTLRNSSLEDNSRIEYLQGHIGGLLEALRNGSNTRGYFVWSFMDTLEFLGGNMFGYGLYYVDFDDSNLERYPKSSAIWYSNFLKGGDITTSSDAVTTDVAKF
ncbi:hypothetical protein FNV43_RR23535 [Rhamnella rubrinervis]|uniref:Beta-glucosidase 11-like n=1 Tax=Rhamnella rubrinervis TaxID=2594499 RepID=A0A8K0DY38_9ROSA|nr:hypothetical protein FNV43_RR23535 [Rhamnella rubrinervis]